MRNDKPQRPYYDSEAVQKRKLNQQLIEIVYQLPKDLIQFGTALIINNDGSTIPTPKKEK